MKLAAEATQVCQRLKVVEAFRKSGNKAELDDLDVSRLFHRNCVPWFHWTAVVSRPPI